MATLNSQPGGHYYFALPRFCARIFGGNARRGERSWLEANLAGWLIFAIAFCFGCAHFVPRFPLWTMNLGLLLLALGIWFFWLLVLYFNSLLLRVLRPLGIFRAWTVSDAQSLLVAILTTAFAFDLVFQKSWLRFPGFIWLAAVALNLLASALLFFLHAARE